MSEEGARRRREGEKGVSSLLEGVATLLLRGFNTYGSDLVPTTTLFHSGSTLRMSTTLLLFLSSFLLVVFLDCPCHRVSIVHWIGIGNRVSHPSKMAK